MRKKIGFEGLKVLRFESFTLLTFHPFNFSTKFVHNLGFAYE